MVIFSHPTGNANSRAALDGLAEAGMLTQFHTSIAAFNGDVLYRLSTNKLFKEIQRRKFDQNLAGLTMIHPLMEIARLLALKAGLGKFTAHEAGMFCIDAVYGSIDKHVASSLRQASKKGAHAVYGYEDGALRSFMAAKNLGMQCLYDLPIGYWRSAKRLLEAEHDKWPDWGATLVGSIDSAKKLERKDEELTMADRIYVASTFTAQTLKEYTGKLAPIEVIPYGFPPAGPQRIYTTIYNRPLKLLFVGGLSQRKGIANLFEAVNKLGKHVILTVVGGKIGEGCPALDKALNKHKWIPSLPHNEILKLMRESDVLVFPSLFEGFGLVITEAMSQGTPVITTDRTAGGDLIANGHNGWLIEAGSTDALKQAIEKIMSERNLIEEIGMAAMETAKKRPWHLYGAELALSIKKQLLNN
jgi:glycosyltransferase involved in cell wall biosynthesis